MKNRTYFFIGLVTLLVSNLLSCTNDKANVTPTNNSNNKCDTTFAFNSRINVILQTNCYGCHSETDVNFPMKPFTKLQTAVLASNSLFLKSIKHQSGASAMPKNATKLSDCDIAAIEKWIINGAKNN